MHVLGLPPAFVLSQDQTLRLKVRFLDRLGGYQSPRNLRNGHLHTLTDPIRVAPNSLHHGDGKKRSFARVSCDLVEQCSPNPQGPRRLRFPFFDQLVKEQQRRVCSGGLPAVCRNDKASSGEPGETEWYPREQSPSRAAAPEVRRNKLGSSPRRMGCQSPF